MGWFEGGLVCQIIDYLFGLPFEQYLQLCQHLYCTNKTFMICDIIMLKLSCVPCSVELDCLGPLLGQIVVALSPVIPHHPQTVADIFNFLIVENK